MNLLSKLKAWKEILQSDQVIIVCSVLVIGLSIVLALPAFSIPLGLPPEGDAVDYRVPFIQWIIRHHSYPNWPWSLVDDYPSLGELLMVPFSFLSTGFARIVPLAAYLGVGILGGLFTANLASDSRVSSRMSFWVGFAWILSLRPLAIQANLLMVDNLATCFLLASFYGIYRNKIVSAGIFAALALATRYSVWPMVAVLPFIFIYWAPPEKRWRNLCIFLVISSFGALPFMIRNFILNGGNPVYPIGDPVFANAKVDNYGRGKDLISFLLLPWDILYTNTFQKGIFDYTVGKLFYVQLAAFVLIGKKIGSFWHRKETLLFLIFALLNTVIWFRFAPQMRFWVPVLVIINVGILVSLLKGPYRWVLPIITLLGIFSALSIQKDSILMAMGKRESIFDFGKHKAAECFQRAGVGNDPVGYVIRDGVIGYFNQDFYFMKEHFYGVRSVASEAAPWIYTLSPREGYMLWPKESPCLLKKIQ